MKILCYGDSNTYGFDPCFGGTGRLPKNGRWTGILAAMPEFQVINEGRNGRCIPCRKWEYEDLNDMLARYSKVDVLTIMLGSNDVYMMFDATAEKIAARMEALFDEKNVPMLQKMKEGGTRIILMAPPAMYLEGSRQERVLSRISQELAEKYREIAARQKVDFLDWNKWNLQMAYDGLHIREAGHIVAAEKMRAFLLG